MISCFGEREEKCFALWLTNWRSAEKARATSCFSWSFMRSVKVSTSRLSSTVSLLTILSPYSWMSKGGCSSWSYGKSRQCRKWIRSLTSSEWSEKVEEIYFTCSSRFSSIFCFQVETRAARSVCFSLLAMLARRASYQKKKQIIWASIR